MSTRRANQALHRMRDTRRRIDIVTNRGYDTRAAGLAQQLNTAALEAIAEELDEIRHLLGHDDAHDLHAPVSAVPHDGFRVGIR